MSKRVVVLALLRNDLRVHDNAVLHAAHTALQSDVTHLMPLYVFDERSIELSGLPGYKREGKEARTRLCGYWRTGAFRARFLTEAVYDLRDRLRKMNSNLLIRYGKTEVVATNVVRALQANGDTVKVFLQQQWTYEEANSQKKLALSLQKLGVHLTYFDTIPLVDVNDLPFRVADTPDVFTPFRSKVEGSHRDSVGRTPLTMPRTFKPFPSAPSVVDPTIIPSYGAVVDALPMEQVLAYLLEPIKADYPEAAGKTGPDYKRDERSAIPFKGGETSALERLDWYFHKGDPPPVARYKETRNGLLGEDYSTKFSTFLSLGLLSPRLISESLTKHESKYGRTDNTYWVRFELLWRDYFNYITRKYGVMLFTLGGFEEKLDQRSARSKAQGWWKSEKSVEAKRWVDAETGVPFIDANMMEIKNSGFMSNRGRQNVASFLTKDLQVDWRVGAEFFESQLIDHEPSANYGNWQYASGVGNDPRASRQFNPIKQGNDFDPHGDFIKTWLPVLALVPANRVQTPWIMSLKEKVQYGLFDGNGKAVAGYRDQPVCEGGHWKSHYGRNPKGGSSKLGVANPSERVKNLGPKSNRPPPNTEEDFPSMGGPARGGKNARGNRA